MKKPRQMGRLHIPGKTLVRNGAGKAILCAWDECEKVGYEEIKIIVNEPGKKLHYIFCSAVHKQFHISSHRTYGKLG